MRLLLVEDEARVARFIARGLREQAYAVDLAADGEDALYQAAVNTYDAIILDVMLPKKDGSSPYACCSTRWRSISRRGTLCARPCCVRAGGGCAPCS